MKIDYEESKVIANKRINDLLRNHENSCSIYDITYLIGYYLEDTPWTNEYITKKSRQILDNSTIKINEEELLNDIQQKFSKLSKSSKTIGIKPQLGYNLNNTPYEIREEWKKNLENLKSLSFYFYYLKNFIKNEKNLRNHWSLHISILLKIFDDSDYWIKIIGCKCLNIVLSVLEKNNYLIKSGLNEEFKKSLEIGFAYLPPLTPINESIKILKFSYLSMIRLIEICFDEDDYIKLIDEEIFNKISLLINLSILEKIRIYEIYLLIMSIVCEKLKTKNVLLLRKYLWVFVLPILTDSLIFVSINNDFLENLFGFLISLLDYSSARISSYKYDLISGLVTFIERYNKEVETPSKTINDLIKKVLKITQDNYGENEKELQELLEKKPIMETYIQL